MTDTTTLMLPSGHQLVLPADLPADVTETILGAFRTEAETHFANGRMSVATAAPAPSVPTQGGSDPDNPDFSAHIRRVRFTLRGEQFNLPGVISAAKLRRIAEMRSALPDMSAATNDAELTDAQINGLMNVVADVLGFLVGGERGTAVRKMVLDEEDGLDLFTESLPLMQYLISRFTGGRPLGQLTPSATGTQADPTATPAAATSSTDGASPAA